jgi:hypothetical protein
MPSCHPSFSFVLSHSTLAHPYIRNLIHNKVFKMSNEEEQYEDSTMGGPGAPTPVSALEVGYWMFEYATATDKIQGVNGLTARDIKLIVEGGFNTVESIAYT